MEDVFSKNMELMDNLKENVKENTTCQHFTIPFDILQEALTYVYNHFRYYQGEKEREKREREREGGGVCQLTPNNCIVYEQARDTLLTKYSTQK